jgi:hypothetical protein
MSYLSDNEENDHMRNQICYNAGCKNIVFNYFVLCPFCRHRKIPVAATVCRNELSDTPTATTSDTELEYANAYANNCITCDKIIFDNHCVDDICNVCRRRNKSVLDFEVLICRIIALLCFMMWLLWSKFKKH